MSPEDFKEIMAGNRRYPLPVKDYCNCIEDEIKRNEAEKFYLMCQRTIDFIWEKYEHKKQKPDLYANPHKIISANASIDKIIISQGVINHVRDCFSNNNTHPNANLIKKIPADKEDFFSEFAIFWIVAHEYFHYHNGHIELKKHHKNLMIAFEFDADCSATAALYRYIEFKYGHILHSDEIKDLALFPIFWCVRTIIGDPLSEIKKLETHPSWHLRMFYAIIKLSIINVHNPSYGSTRELVNSVEKIALASFNLEKDYQIKENNIEQVNLIKHLIIDNPAHKEPEHSLVMAAWNLAAPLILNYTKMAPGIVFMNFPAQYKNPQYNSLYGKKLSHHYKSTYIDAQSKLQLIYN